MYQDLVDYFDIKDYLEEIKNKNFLVNREKEHSQIETRKYYLTSDIEWLSSKEKWNKMFSIEMVEKIIEKDEEKSIERRYYITSLSETEIEDFARTVRNERTIENNLHWHLDVTFEEDKNLSSQKQEKKSKYFKKVMFKYIKNSSTII